MQEYGIVQRALALKQLGKADRLERVELHAGGAAAQIAIDQNDPCSSQRCGSGEANSRCGLAFAGQGRRDGYYGGLLVGPGEMDRGAQTAERFGRSEEHTSELQSLMRISYAVFCLKKTTRQTSKHCRHT